MPALLEVKLLDSECHPIRAYPNDAGLDLKCQRDTTIWPLETKEVDTGIAIKLPAGFVGLIVPRSSWRKRGLVIQATYDAGFTGPVQVQTTFISPGRDPIVIKRGERFAQLIIVPLTIMPLTQVQELGETTRGENGLGSTGE